VPPGRTSPVGEDVEVRRAIAAERARREESLGLSAAESPATDDVLAALGSIFTDRYAEGYPGRRFYGGCSHVDAVEQLAVDRARTLFAAEHANVQPHSGGLATMAALFALAAPGDPILGPDLAHGGHMTGGDPLNYSGRLFRGVRYGVRRDTERVDLDQVRDLARRHRPRVVIAGGTSFPRALDIAAFRSIADEVGAALVVDAAQLAGLVAAGLHPSPAGVADAVTITTHQTLRGPHGGILLATARHAGAVDRAVMPGIQAGPHPNVVAAKAVALGQAGRPDWRAYQERVVANARALAGALADRGLRPVTGGTDTHMVLVDLTSRALSGARAQAALDAAGIAVNRNAVPFDPRGLAETSGIRLGTAEVTVRGMGPAEMVGVAVLVDRALGAADPGDLRALVADLARRFPLAARRSAA
jgi:glycine hydroxymethyltransferase